MKKKKNTNRSQNYPQIAIIGCGAFAEKYYLPAFAKTSPSILKTLILVDKNLERARQLASKFNVQRTVDDYRNILNQVEGVIVSVPHSLHYRISMDFLKRGVHVLCEKPLALSANDALEMISQAHKSGAILLANYTQRLFPSSLMVKNLLSSGAIGRPLSIKYTWGSEFNWPTTTGFYFDANTSPKGVLIDRGAHPMDLICWWLEAKPKLIFSKNDSFGGPEAVACVKLEHEGCIIEIMVSWLSQLQDQYIIHCESGTIVNGIEDWWVLPVSLRSGKKLKVKLESKEKDYFDFGQKIVSNFINVIRKEAMPLIPADSVMASVELIEESYGYASRFKMPWYDLKENFVEN